MFCCTVPGHQGQIITSCCQHIDCISTNKQLCCISCIKQIHEKHNKQIISMKKIIPQLLQANNMKKYYYKILEGFVGFVQEQFGEDSIYKSILGNNKLKCENVTQVTKLLLLQMKRNNKQQSKKIKQIQKTLKIKNEGKILVSPSKSTISNYQSVNFRTTIDQYNKNTKYNQSIPLSTSIISGIQSFSNILKHPYINISSDGKIATKSSQASGYKLAVLSANPIPSNSQSIFFNIKIIKSSGNILIGLGIADIIKQKQYLNCYGNGHGTFLLGQNSNNNLSSILFHHNDNMYNRKQIVGWNYKQGQIISVGILQQNNVQFVSFRKYYVKNDGQLDFRKVSKQFNMPLWNKQNNNNKLLHVVVLLQNIGDQVQFIQNQE